MKISKEARSARDIVYDIQKASACIRQDNAHIDQLFEELQALVDGPKNESANDAHDHNPVQHRDGKEPWCNICFKTADGRDPDYHIDAVGQQGGRSLAEGYLKLEFVTEVGNSTKIETIRKFDELTIEDATAYDDEAPRGAGRFIGEPIGFEMTIKLVWHGATPTHVVTQGKR